MMPVNSYELHLDLAFVLTASGSTHRGSRLRQLQFPFDSGKIKECRDELEKAAAWMNLVLSAEAAIGQSDALASASIHEGTRPRRLGSIGSETPTTPSIGLGEGPRLLETSQNQTLPWLQRLHRIDTQSIHTDVDDAHLRPIVPVTSSQASHARQRDSTETSSTHSTDRSSQMSFMSSVPLRLPEQGSAARAAAPTTAVVPTKVWYPEPASRRALDRTVEIDPPYQHEILEKLDRNKAFAGLGLQLLESQKVLARNANIDDLLLRAVWWLLKARIIFAALSTVSDTVRTARPAWPMKASKLQATTDFWKSCWILKSMVLTEQNAQKQVSDMTWSALQELAASIHEELYASDGLSEVLDEAADVRGQGLAFEEQQYQPIEALSCLPAGLDDIESPARFVTVQQDDAGATRKEKVLFRTFVDAKIGPHETRRRSSGAPYMLLLSCQHGRSEILVTLFNQAGTINLCTPLTDEDLQRHKKHTTSELQFEIHFPSQDAVVQFLSPVELQRFFDLPEAMFLAQSNRHAREDEFLIFREGLQSFDHRTPQPQPKANVNRNDHTTKAHSSCEISLYGAVPTECWKTVRRLVVSSALDVTHPWCHSYWLPISNIQVHGEERDVELSWSDCSNLMTWGDGEYGHFYSYVWNPDRPNHIVNVQFETLDAADEFRASILRPWATPFEFDNLSLVKQFGSVSSTRGNTDILSQDKELSIWRLRDLQTKALEYLSIVSVERRPYYGYTTTVHFLGSGVDIAIEEIADHSLHFPALWGPKYLSNVIKTRRKPTLEAECADIEWTERDATFHFANEDEMALFAKTIVDWDLKFYCRAPSMQMGHGLHSTMRDVIVSLWEKPSGSSPFDTQIMLTIRWMGEILRNDEYRWLTAKIESPNDCIAKADARKMTLRRVTVCQGDELDIQSLRAVDAHGQVSPRTGREVVLKLPDDEAVRRLHSYISELLCGPSASQGLAYRTRSSNSGSGMRRSIGSLRLGRSPRH